MYFGACTHIFTLENSQKYIGHTVWSRLPKTNEKPILVFTTFEFFFGSLPSMSRAK